MTYKFAAATFLAAWLLASTANAQDVEAGRRAFGKCRSCHQVGETARNGIGPTLNGLFGRHAGTVEGYSYSASNKEADITWSPESFAAYIRDPKASMPGTKMVFAGIKADPEIADLTAYLKQFDDAGHIAGP